MNTVELLVTPFYLILILMVANVVKPRFTDARTNRYFIPALSVKLFGALAVGLIYQFYYKGGDTLNYYFLGSTHVWHAFLDSPIIAFKLIFLAGSEYESTTFQYASRIVSYGDLPTYFVVRVAGLFSLLTLNSYYSISLLFAVLSFTGTWALYTAFYRLLPHRHFSIAIVVLFVPSVFFWGSGLLKDSLTFGALGWLIFCFLEIAVHGKRGIAYLVIMLLSIYVIYAVKIYILLSILPALVIFIFLKFLSSFRQMTVKILMAPIILTIAIVNGYYAVEMVGFENTRYSFDRFLNTAQTSAEWLYTVSEQQGGSAYSLGNNDFTSYAAITKFFPAVWVSLYRPYLWEAHNLVMFISALESLAMLIITVWVIYTSGLINFFRNIFSSPLIMSLLIFSLIFAFSIGFSTYNFGSLVRYKIPLIPLFLFALLLIREKAVKPRFSAQGFKI